ncbi:efflux transporter outer membrane subunit [Erythrobacter sp. 3-20A1M]|uniref:efflux transporter outer membrane subunit n=1 Tax=Erythrobacter sp. 3-20A1M TaxID=2653850 RepID=UPI0035303355
MTAEVGVGLFHFKGLGTGALALALAACSTSGQLATPDAGIAVPERWSDPAPSVALDPVSYWTALDDPLLDRFVALALENNRDLAQAASRVAIARAGVRASRASYLPQISGTAGVQRNFGSFVDTDPRFSVGADAQWEIDLFGRISNDVAASRAELAAAGYGLADLQRLIVGQVAQTTISARTLATQLAIARETLAIQDDNLQIAQWRLQAGLVSSLDVEQARAQRAQTAASIPALERDLAQAANTISTLLGEAPGPVRAELEEATPTIPQPPGSVGLALPAEVLRQRPDVRQAEAFLLADTARIDIARAQLLPLVRLSGNVGSGSFGLSALFDTITGSLFAGVSQLIFDGGRTRAQIDSARAVAAGSLAAWQQTILQALTDVENANIALSKARQRVAELAIARDAASNAALLARSQYQAGLIDFQTLLTAESQLLSARNALAAAEAERANAFVALEQAAGGGWDPTRPIGQTTSIGEDTQP